MTEPLLHLLPAADVDHDATVYAPASLEVEGFVPCATVAQVAGMARLLFAGTPQLQLMVIDPRLLDSELRWRDLYGIGQEFPCVYGPIPRRAIVELRPFPPGRGGRWSRPDIAPLT